MKNEKITIITDELFKIGKYEMIKFSEDNGRVIAVFKDCPLKTRFGQSNNLAESEILKCLNKEVLPYIEDIIGAENVLKFETDLISLDGSRQYGIINTRISIPTFDFYRLNVKLFDKYNPNKWWWLATPYTTTNHDNDQWCVCVSPFGSISSGYVKGNRGVRPFLCFSSSIFDSLKKVNG